MGARGVQRTTGGKVGGKAGAKPARKRARPIESDIAPDDAEARLELAQLSNAVGYALRRAQLVVFADFIRRFAELDLKPAQYSILVAVGENPGRRQSEIAAALGIKRPNFAVLLDELERRGLAQRVPSPLDRRSHALVLTPAGEALLARARALHDEQEAAWADALGADGRDKLVELATRLAGFRGRDEIS